MIRKNMIAVGLAAFLAAGSLIPACSGSVSADNVQSSAVQSADTEQTDTGQTQDAAADPGGKGSETSADTGAAEASEVAGASADNAAADPAAGSAGNEQNAAGDAQNASGSGQNEAETAGEQTGNGTVTTDADGQRILTFSYEDDQMYVTASFSDPNAISDQAELTVTPVTADTEGYNYEAYMQALNDSVGNEISPKGGSYNETNTALYDIAFLMKKRDADGNIIKDDYYEVEPDAGTCTVTMTMKQAQFTKGLGASDESLKIIHLPISETVRSAYETTEEATGIQASDVQTEAVPDRDVELDQGGQDKVAFQMNSFSVIAATSNPSLITNDTMPAEDYTIEYLLNHYNAVTLEGDLVNGSHFMGAVISAGKLKTSSFNDTDGTTQGVSSSSYIKGTVDSSCQGANTRSQQQSPPPVYLGTSNKVDANFNRNGSTYFTDSYIDFEKLAQSISSESAAVANEATETVKVNQDWETINVTAGSNVVIDLNGHEYYNLNLVGDTSKATIINYLGTGDITHVALNFKINGQDANGSETSSSMNLLWNFPNSTGTVTSTKFGHVVAPHATISLTAQYNGCVIGKEITGSGEGHMWPYTGGKLIPTTGQIEAVKTVNGKTPDSKYTFKLWKLSNNTWEEKSTVQNNGQSVIFPSETYSAAGDYWYKITEDTSAAADGVLYDETVYLAKVHVVSKNTQTDVNTVTTTCCIESITYYKLDQTKGGSAAIKQGTVSASDLEGHTTDGLLTKSDSASFDNKLDSLVIKKTFDDKALTTKLTDDQKKAVSFTVTGPDGYSKTFTYGEMTSGTYTIEGLKAGTYTVTETATAVDGTALTSTWTVKTAGSDGTESGNTSGSGTTANGAALVSGGSAEVDFTNTYAPAKGGLRITKEVTVNGQATKSTAADGTYYFSVKNADGKYVKDQTTGELQDKRQLFTITITNGESSSLDFTGLAPGTYTIQEGFKDHPLPDGMTLAKINGIDAGGKNTVTVTVTAGNTSDLSAATAVFTNNKTVVVNMPESGSTSALRVMLTGFGLLAAGMLIMIIFRRKEDMRKRR